MLNFIPKNLLEQFLTQPWALNELRDEKIDDFGGLRIWLIFHVQQSS